MTPDELRTGARAAPGEPGQILRSALDHAADVARKMPMPADGVRASAFVVRDGDGTEVGAGVFLNDQVALTGAMRDSVRDGRFRPDSYAIEFTWHKR